MRRFFLILFQVWAINIIALHAQSSEDLLLSYDSIGTTLTHSDRKMLRPVIYADTTIHVGWVTSSGLLGSADLERNVLKPVQRPYEIYRTRHVDVIDSSLTAQPSVPLVVDVTTSFSTEKYPDMTTYRNTVAPTSHRIAPGGGWRMQPMPQLTYYYWQRTPLVLTPSSFVPVYEPNQRRLVYFMRFPPLDHGGNSFPRQNFWSFRIDDTSKTYYWSSAVDANVLGFVPIDSTNDVFLLVNENSLRRYSGSIVMRPGIEMRRVDDRRGEKTVLLQRLYGERLLRITASPQLPTRSLEIYNFFGVKVAQRQIPFDPSARGIAVVQSRSDSTIFLIEAHADGVDAVPFGQNLEGVRTIHGEKVGVIQISRTTDSTAYPAGVFHDERIFVAWEDYRAGDSISMIRGNWYVLPRLIPSDDAFDPYDSDLAIEFGPAPSVSILSAIPNPLSVNGTLQVRALHPQSGRIVVYNIQGEALSSTDVELIEGINTYHYDIPTSDGGCFLVQIICDDGIDDITVFLLGE